MTSHNKFHAKFEQTIPDQLSYKLPKASVPVTRRTVRYNPVQATSFSDTTTRVAQIIIPSVSFIDSSSIYLKFKHKSFDLRANSTTAPFPSGYYGGMACLIQRLRIVSLADGTTIEDISDYDNLSEMLGAISTPEDQLTNALKTLSGTGRTEVERTIDGRTGKYYCLKPLSGFLRSNKYIPMKYLKGGIQLEIYFQDLAASHQDSSPDDSQSYEVTDLHLECDVVNFEDSLIQSMDALVQQKGIDMHFETYQYQPRQVGTDFNQVFSLAERSKSLKTVLIGMRNNNVVNSITHNSYTRTRNGLSKYQFDLSGIRLPTYQVSDTSAETFSELVKAFGGNVSGAGLKNWYSTEYCLARDFSHVEGLVSGSSHSENLQDITLMLEFQSPVQARLDCFFHSDVLLTISADGRVDKFM